MLEMQFVSFGSKLRCACKDCLAGLKEILECEGGTVVRELLVNCETVECWALGKSRVANILTAVCFTVQAGRGVMP